MNKTLIAVLIVLVLLVLIRKFTKGRESESESGERRTPLSQEEINQAARDLKIIKTTATAGEDTPLTVNPNFITVEAWKATLKPNWRETGSLYGFDVSEDPRAKETDKGLEIPIEKLNNQERAQLEVNNEDMKKSQGAGGINPFRR